MVQQYDLAAEGERWAAGAFLGLVEADGEGLKGGAVFSFDAGGCWFLVFGFFGVAAVGWAWWVPGFANEAAAIQQVRAGAG